MKETACRQIDRLAKFMLDHQVLGESSCSEGAIDVSIRLHRILIQAIATISTQPGFTHMTPREVMDKVRQLEAEVHAEI